MPKGFAGAKKAGEYSGGGGGFQPRPKGITYFSLKDGQEAIVRFLQAAEDIDWARKWKLPPSKNFQYGELVNCVDQHEDGTPDPGYAAGLKTSFKAYPTLIWRNAPAYQKDKEGKLVKDGNGNKVIVGYQDTVAVWECSYAVYESLQECEETYRGLMNLDWKIKRKGASTDTKYVIVPADPTQINVPFTQQDQQLAQNQRIDTSAFTKIPTFDELNAYITGGVTSAPQPSFTQQAQTNATGMAGPNPFLS
jgi:hypothetical protein